jgi:hypothetical protein
MGKEASGGTPLDMAHLKQDRQSYSLWYQVEVLDKDGSAKCRTRNHQSSAVTMINPNQLWPNILFAPKTANAAIAYALDYLKSARLTKRHAMSCHMLNSRNAFSYDAILST